MKSWKTTLAGVASILTVTTPVLNDVAHNGLGALVAVDWHVFAAGWAVGIGLICARDHSAPGATPEGK